MTLSIFMDESNTHDGTEYLTVSAAWAEPEIWAAWSKDWAESIKPIKIFHSVDVHNRKGECKGWSREDRDAMVIRSLHTFPKHQIRGAVASLNRKKLARGLARRPGIMSTTGHEYLIAFMFVVGNALKTLPNETLNFFHEEKPEWGARAFYHFEKLKKRHNRSTATFAFASKAAHPPLQCADLYAYEGHQQLRLDRTFVNIRPTWRAINVARDKIIVNALIADDDVIEKLCTTLVEWFDLGAKGGIADAP